MKTFSLRQLLPCEIDTENRKIMALLLRENKLRLQRIHDNFARSEGTFLTRVEPRTAEPEWLGRLL